MSRRPARRDGLRALAERMGILPGFVDVRGRRRRTSDATREALLAAMGCPASSEAEARATLEHLDAAARARLLPPVRVIRGATGAAPRLPASLARRGRCELEVTEENGAVRRGAGALSGLPSGYHRLRLRVSPRGQAAREAEQLLIVAPRRASIPRGRRFGLTANLWTVASARNWGAGDLTDLAELGAWAGAGGAAFVGVNPLYAVRNRRGDESPYSPVSRLFRNPLYLDVTAIPEFAESAEARQLVAAPVFRTSLERVRAGDTVDHARVMALKRDVLQAVFRTFQARHAGRDTPRDHAYRRYRAAREALVADFATFLALEEHLGASDWREWPPAFHDPRGAPVRAFGHAQADAVDFHRWVQFELDRQLAAAAQRAEEAGLARGFIGDLPVGTAPSSSDTWAFPGLFAPGVQIGAPPDDYAPGGQAWGLAPLDPHRLRAERHGYWMLVVRSALEHMGALRVDHVMGLLRQYWIPAGRPAGEGAYVRYPAEELFAILSIESARRGAAVIGEDLGTVPPEIPRLLRRWGVLSTQVMYFARERRGRFLPAHRYSRRAFVLAGTHDQPPLAAWWSGRDLTLRRQAGAIASERALAAERAGRARARRALVARLVAERVWPSRARAPESAAALTRAVYAYLARTPAPLLGVALDDLAGADTPLHLPGVPPARAPGWIRRVPRSLEALRADPAVQNTLAGVAAVRGPA